ncbi:putative ATPase, AAA-type, core, sigma-54 interaction domain, ATP-binding site 1 [Medicago truncatula]|uniref:Putative ATPase, AAA-type, core, sigma-54 interaction domain, ATP-binding site 1 n=1 Tax=Medicago truncatula TaxID=3880 RepID=A0A396GJ98_MEDTR|nr:AAA-ATPase At2g46620 [Medicago truncatula]RHN39674.1 putative ATPase, AAA-type, core, sigma-54 interaction domain, ATP-binding site 1 [Medicago truncatula]
MLSYKFIILIPLTPIILFIIRYILFKTGLIHTTKKLHKKLQDFFYLYQYLKVPELNQTMQPNMFYRKVSLYLHSLPSLEDSDFTNLITGNNQNDIVLTLDSDQIIEDRFLGATVYWFYTKTEPNQTGAFVIKIRKTDKRRILSSYLHHITTMSAEIEYNGKRDLRLFVNITGGGGGGRRWRSVPFNHPSTFETMLMETDLKNRIKNDLESFLKAKNYYRRLGRVWKRSFLLYGESGTGKSSFVAAMANFLCYDVYDVDLSKIQSDSDLKFLLLETSPKSIIVVEDLDRFITAELESPATVTSVGIQNFMDGIMTSSYAEGRIMIFTMNSKEFIDPNFLRPGRVDVHIHFPVCDFSSFKALANSYLGVKEHKLFPAVDEIFRQGASLSPAEIGELMIANRNSPSRAIKSVIGALQMDGDGRGCGDMIVRRIEDDDVEDESNQGGLCGGDGFSTVKDLKKIYGLLRLRNVKRNMSGNLLVNDEGR